MIKIAFSIFLDNAYCRDHSLFTLKSFEVVSRCIFTKSVGMTQNTIQCYASSAKACKTVAT